MDATPSRKQLTHDRIVETAGRAIRRAGFQGVGVADIMKEAGLTHGGFYAHFPSRDALLVEALDCLGQKGASRMAARAAAQPVQGVSALRVLVDGYLSERHLAEIESGCPVAALISEVPRQSPEVRDAAGQRVRGLIAAVQRSLPPKSPAGAAGVIASQLVGALQMARVLGESAEGRALLAQSRKSLLAQFDSDSTD
jgi:TetR/AcrR family transcriptional repressor of nem operon